MSRPLVTDDEMTDALAILGDETGAAARAAHEYMDALTKTVLAQLMGQSNESSVAAKELWARSQPDFKAHLEKVGSFAKDDYRWKQRYAAAAAKIEIWRTSQANIRAAERVR